MAKLDKQKDEVVFEEVTEEISESSENIEVPVEVKPEPPKPYIHIDTFLRTATPMFHLNNMQVAGFKARMRGRHYQFDQEVFIQELKQYLNLK